MIFVDNSSVLTKGENMLDNYERQNKMIYTYSELNEYDYSKWKAFIYNVTDKIGESENKNG